MEVTQPVPKREEILRLAKIHGAQRVRVFGSRARGDGQPDSDLDLLVIMDRDRSLLDLIGFQQDVEDLVQCPVDVVTESALHPYIKEKVLSEAVPL